MIFDCMANFGFLPCRKTKVNGGEEEWKAVNCVAKKRLMLENLIA